jgi:class 3 adenylate cyclase
VPYLSEELTNLLNHYLTEMSKIALDHGATIDKYVGDAIIAFFGDPETRGVKEDARTCVNMAVAMQRRMRELRSEWLAIYQALGIPQTAVWKDELDRPHHVYHGQPIDGLM